MNHHKFHRIILPIFFCVCTNGFAASLSTVDTKQITDVTSVSPIKIDPIIIADPNIVDPITIDPIITRVPATCRLKFPMPKLAFKGTKPYSDSSGKRYTQYNLEVTNRDEIPDVLFQSDSGSPACSASDNSSRTSVGVYNVHGYQLTNYCFLSTPSSLGSLAYSVPEGARAPNAVYVEMNDSFCKKTYRSNVVKVYETDPTPKIDVNCDDDGFNAKEFQTQIANAEAGTVFQLSGTCRGIFTVPATVNDVTFDGIGQDGQKTVISSPNSSYPAFSIDGAQNITVKNIEFTQSFIGIAVINGASANLIKVDAHDNTNGIVVDTSKVSADDITAKFNKYFGVKALHKSTLTLKDLDGTKRVQGPFVHIAGIENTAGAQTASLPVTALAADTASDPNADNSTAADADVVPAPEFNCDVQINGNVNVNESRLLIGLQKSPTDSSTLTDEACLSVLSAPTDGEGAPEFPGTGIFACDASNLIVKHCVPDLGNNVLGSGLEVVDGSHAEFINSSLNIHGNNYGVKVVSSTVLMKGTQADVAGNNIGLDTSGASLFSLTTPDATDIENSEPMMHSSLIFMGNQLLGSNLHAGDTFFVETGSHVAYQANVLGFFKDGATVSCDELDVPVTMTFVDNVFCNGVGDKPACSEIMNKPAASPGYCF